MKKRWCISFVLLFALLFGMGVQAASLTLSGAGTLSAYPIFTAEKHGSAVWYSINPDYQDALTKAAAATGITLDADSDGILTNEEAVAALSGLSAAQARTLANALATRVSTGGYHTTNGSFANLPYGWYLIKGDEVRASFVQVTEDVVTRDAKQVSEPSYNLAFATGARAITASMGDTVTISQTVSYPNEADLTIQFSVPVFESSSQNVEVRKNGTVLTSGVTVSGGRVQVSGGQAAGETFEIRQTLTLDRVVTDSTGLPFTGSLTYQGMDGSNKQSVAGTLVVYSASVSVRPINMDGTAINARYELTKADGTAADLSGGLADGDYILKETWVEDGYVKAEDLPFTIASVFDETGRSRLTATGEGVSVQDGAIVISIAHGLSGTLPDTGSWVRIVVLGGGAVLVGAGAVLLVRRKKK